MKKSKVLIEIKGGIIQSILVNHHQFEIVVIDYDNIESGDKLNVNLFNIDAIQNPIFNLLTGKNSIELHNKLKEINF